MKKQLLLFVVFFLFLMGNLFAQTVYITKTGTKYHKATCKYLSKSSISISLTDALAQGYTECSVCKPSSVTTTTTGTTTTTTTTGTTGTTTKQQTQSEQCSATTKAGTRCKRMTLSPNGKCWQHGGD